MRLWSSSILQHQCVWEPVVVVVECQLVIVRISFMQASKESLEPVFSVLINAAGLCRQCLSSWEYQGLYAKWDSFSEKSIPEKPHTRTPGSIRKSKYKPPLPIRQTWTYSQYPGWVTSLFWVTDSSSLVLSNVTGILVSTNGCFPEKKFFLWNCCSLPVPPAAPSQAVHLNSKCSQK